MKIYIGRLYMASRRTDKDLPGQPVYKQIETCTAGPRTINMRGKKSTTVKSGVMGTAKIFTDRQAAALLQKGAKNLKKGAPRKVANNSDHELSVQESKDGRCDADGRSNYR